MTRLYNQEATTKSNYSCPRAEFVQVNARSGEICEVRSSVMNTMPNWMLFEEGTSQSVSTIMTFIRSNNQPHIIQNDKKTYAYSTFDNL